MSAKRDDLVGGLVLIGIGLLFLVSRFVDFGNLGLLILPLLGVAFMTWGILTREDGLMVPGGILSGVGVGVYLIAGPLALPAGIEEGGIFLLSLGAGFASITLFTALFGKETHWWGLIPGGIIALVGLSVLFGGVFMDVLSAAGKYWPVILIGVGVYTIFKAVRQPELKEKSVEDVA